MPHKTLRWLLLALALHRGAALRAIPIGIR
jgi:hypothetical protein